MFACFALKRIDVFSTGDLGVQRGMARLLGQDVEKLKKAGKGAKGGGKWKYMTEKEMQEMAEKFKPYRFVRPFVYSTLLQRLDDPPPSPTPASPSACRMRGPPA